MTNEDARVELVVKIDEKTYEDIKKGKVYNSYYDVPLESVLAIANGIPLPKGHGRLIDADALMKLYGLEDATKYGNETAEQQTYSYSTMMMYEIADMLDNAPPVIESESEDKE